MCDFPTAGVITTHETHKSWIIFKDNTTHIGNFRFTCLLKSKYTCVTNFHASATHSFVSNLSVLFPNCKICKHNDIVECNVEISNYSVVV